MLPVQISPDTYLLLDFSVMCTNENKKTMSAAPGGEYWKCSNYTIEFKTKKSLHPNGKIYLSM
jgi:hypothetical protein